MGFTADLSSSGVRAVPTVARMRVLTETVFTGMSIQTFTHGQTFVEPGGLAASIEVPAGGSVAIVSNGLKCMHPTSSSAQVMYTYAAPTLANIVGLARWHRGDFAIWNHYVDTNMGATGFATIMLMNGGYPGCGIGIRRRANVFGDHWFGSEVNPQLRGTTNATDLVVCAYVRRAPVEVDILFGAWTNGWPEFGSLSLGGTIFGTPSYANLRDADSFQLTVAGGGVTGDTTKYMVTDRWRITSWD